MDDLQKSVYRSRLAPWSTVAVFIALSAAVGGCALDSDETDVGETTLTHRSELAGGSTQTFAGAIGKKGLKRVEYELVIEEPVAVSARLEWDRRQADLHLYLEDASGHILAASASSARPESLQHEITGAGSYTLVVEAVSNHSDYTLEVSLQAPTSGDGTTPDAGCCDSSQDVGTGADAGAGSGGDADSGEPTEPTPAGGLYDPLDAFDSNLWHHADGWSNGSFFWCGWRADHVVFDAGHMTLRLDDDPCRYDASLCSGEPYASGEYRTNQSYGYGRYEVRMKAARGSGVVSSFFLYTGPTDGTVWDEIDIEFLGRDTTKLQTNYFTDGVGSHETVIDLGFDAADAFHTYAFEWAPDAIRWYVDGHLVHTEDGSRGALPSHPGRIMMNVWPATGADSWTGPFSYDGNPIKAQYDWVRFTPLSP